MQSTAMLAKKLAPDDVRQRVVIAARLNAGIAMRVDVLRGCLGDCCCNTKEKRPPKLRLLLLRGCY